MDRPSNVQSWWIHSLLDSSAMMAPLLLDSATASISEAVNLTCLAPSSCFPLYISKFDLKIQIVLSF